MNANSGRAIDAPFAIPCDKPNGNWVMSLKAISGPTALVMTEGISEAMSEVNEAMSEAISE